MIDDLITHGHVKTYDKFDAKSEGEQVYNDAIRIHEKLSSPAKILTKGEAFKIEFLEWKKANKNSGKSKFQIIDTEADV